MGPDGCAKDIKKDKLEESAPEVMSDKKVDTAKVKLTKVTEADVAKLGVILQVCASSGDWTLSGIFPDKNCKNCLGLGHLGRNVKLNIFLLCPCILKKIQEAMKFYQDMMGRVEEEKKGEKNGTEQTRTEQEGVVENITTVEEGKVSRDG
jgi:hypothetical protein